MAGPNGDVLNYGLYKDDAHTVAWGDGTGETEEIADTGNGLAQPKPIYASIMPNQQTAHAGSYADQVTVTLTY